MVSKLLFTSVMLLALGIAIILFEELAANNNANFHPCPPTLHCDFIVPQYELSIGVFPLSAGAILFGFYKVTDRAKILDSKQR